MINDIDLKIIDELYKSKHSVGELVILINIAPVNMWKHLNKLDKLEIIKVINNGRGKKKEISLKLNREIKLIDFIRSLEL